MMIGMYFRIKHCIGVSQHVFSTIIAGLKLNICGWNACKLMLELYVWKQTAWNCLNDCLRSDICVKYQSNILACAAIHMASKLQQISLPQNPPWWPLFDAKLVDIELIVTEILSIYEYKPASKW